ncbi:adenylyl-sulfate kinase [Candidatus Nitronereus thalassa]|uniref:Adenylyl-sulfate kinase n=1 Tax=Candidatus Nitronereus thalassa TaxID=3020898 RepID=A0ABU3K601_9BACT|nr:adenylyl-sulfate kinase [Candidatus Nitronereus thalassa]MDT7041849.1 adenylyl-sulfate kinase [Candidatus Nitronereus thalassa]
MTLHVDNNQLAFSSLPSSQRGFCVWFTGLSASGKSTTAQTLTSQFLELGREVTLLDGDVIRTHLSKELGFSREDRNTNIRRIGFVAKEIVRHGGIVVCATISPYCAIRQEVRQMIGENHFIEVFMNTPLQECQRRDPKGLYSKAARGQLSGFTGIDDPYEQPLSPELQLETTHSSPEANAELVVGYVKTHGWLQGSETRIHAQFHSASSYGECDV